jgi:hypothetical protein
VTAKIRVTVTNVTICDSLKVVTMKTVKESLKTPSLSGFLRRLNADDRLKLAFFSHCYQMQYLGKEAYFKQSLLNLFRSWLISNLKNILQNILQNFSTKNNHQKYIQHVQRLNKFDYNIIKNYKSIIDVDIGFGTKSFLIYYEAFKMQYKKVMVGKPPVIPVSSVPVFKFENSLVPASRVPRPVIPVCI